MKKMIFTLALAMACMSHNLYAQKVPDMNQALEFQAKEVLGQLQTAGGELSSGNSSNACFFLGQSQSSLKFTALILFQAFQSGMGDKAKLGGAMKAFGDAFTGINGSASHYCSLNNAMDGDRKALLGSMNRVGAALAPFAKTVWSDIKL